MRHPGNILLLLFCNLGFACIIYGQEPATADSNKLGKMQFSHNKFVNNIFRQAVNSMMKSPDAGLDDGYLNGKSEDPYLPYQGKVIRHIYVETINFDRSFTDTSKRDKGFFTRVGKRLHKSTREFVIRNNLFIKENTPLNPYKVADNERYIRSLEFISDVRIVIDTSFSNCDSVDITVFTKDLFSIAGGGASEGANHINANIYDANLMGLGQRLELSGLYDYNRTPNWGYGGLYRKSNIGGSFIDGTVGYSVMGIGPYTHQEESSRYITLSRQLVSPYSRVAGAITLSRNQAYDVYHIPDSLHYTYRYELFDAWAGYNIGIRQLTATNNSIRDRRFLAVRYYNRNFTEVDSLIGNRIDPIFNSSQAVLGQLTFFRQDYYKTQYIYGFGTTEDLPYGYNIAVTGGWHKQHGMERPYAGASLSDYIATNHGDFIQLYLRFGGFLYQKQIQDGSFLVGTTAYSRIYFLNSTKIRQFMNLNYTYLHNRTTYAPLRIDNYFGLRGFLSDSVYGTQRLSLQLETEFFVKFKLLGFHFAPFPWGDLTLVKPAGELFTKSSLYTSLGAGIRARNENLVFETIEMRAYFFPITPTNMKGFKIIVNANIRFRYSSNYITAPDIVQLNQF